VAALMTRHSVFFFEQQQAQTRESPGDFERDRKPDDTSADDYNVVTPIAHDR
jgi:hypothetical protein